MPILVYFKEPAISLVMSGRLDKATIKKLHKNKGLRPILLMADPDGQPQVLFPRSDIDIAYMKEITLEEWQEMKKRAQARAAGGPGGPIISPAQFFGTQPGGKKGGGN